MMESGEATLQLNIEANKIYLPGSKKEDKFTQFYRIPSDDNDSSCVQMDLGEFLHQLNLQWTPKVIVRLSCRCASPLTKGVITKVSQPLLDMFTCEESLLLLIEQDDELFEFFGEILKSNENVVAVGVRSLDDFDKLVTKPQSDKEHTLKYIHKAVDATVNSDNKRSKSNSLFKYLVFSPSELAFTLPAKDCFDCAIVLYDPATRDTSFRIPTVLIKYKQAAEEKQKDKDKSGSSKKNKVQPVKSKSEKSIKEDTTKAESNRQAHNKISTELTLEQACRKGRLPTEIFKVLKEHHDLKEDKKDCFLLRMTLNVLDHEHEGEALDWDTETIKTITQEAIRGSKYNFLSYMIQRNVETSEIKRGIDEHLVSSSSVLEKWKGRFETLLFGTRRVCRIQGAFLELFIQSIMSYNLEGSLFFWTQLSDHLIAGALAAHGVLKNILDETNVDSDIRKKIKTSKKYYQHCAIELLQQCYRKNEENTRELLVQKMSEWNGYSCIQLAMTTKNMKFLSQEPCSELREDVWNNYERNCAQDEDTLHISAHLVKPWALFYADLVCYILFLLLYGVLLVSALRTSYYDFLEFYVFLFIVIFSLEEINQSSRETSKFADKFSKIDIFAVLLYVLAWSLRWFALAYPSHGAWMDATRICFSLDYVLFSIKMLEYFYVFENVGPIMIMIKDMIVQTLRFLLILTVFFAAYVVASESVLYPEASLSWRFFFYFLRKGFWAMFGEFFLDELEASGDDCNSNETLYTTYEKVRCPTDVGKYFVPILMAVYIIFIQILLFSLLVALFNSSITETEKRRNIIWHYQKFYLTVKYTQSYFPLLPFTLVRPLFKLKFKNPFTKDIDIFSDLKDFERSSAKDLLDNIDNGSIFKELKRARNQDLKEEEEVTMSKLKSFINHSFDSFNERLTKNPYGTAQNTNSYARKRSNESRVQEKKGQANTQLTKAHAQGSLVDVRSCVRLTQTDIRSIATEVAKLLRHSESTERFLETASIYRPSRDKLGLDRGLGALNTDGLTEEAALVVLKTPGQESGQNKVGKDKLTISRAKTRLFAIRSRNKRGLEWRCIKVRPLADKKPTNQQQSVEKDVNSNKD